MRQRSIWPPCCMHSAFRFFSFFSIDCRLWYFVRIYLDLSWSSAFRTRTNEGKRCNLQEPKPDCRWVFQYRNNMQHSMLFNVWFGRVRTIQRGPKSQSHCNNYIVARIRFFLISICAASKQSTAHIHRRMLALIFICNVYCICSVRCLLVIIVAPRSPNINRVNLALVACLSY